ncbi:MAG: PAS domain S-box protein [Desulfobacteraceae bacterium]|nr:PAS domain S-box protein [Desulfobacteraceae bacterium]
MTDKTKSIILIVDDEPNNHRVYESILEPLNLEIVNAMSGQKALEVAHRYDFFLILMDVQMPNIDGFEAAGLILGHPKTSHIPVIFITAIARDEIFEFKGYKSGAVDYLVKPINDDILRCKVNVFLKMNQQRKELQAERDYSTGIIRKTRALICTMAPDGTCNGVNPAGERVTGYARDEIIGKNCWRLFHPDKDLLQIEQLFCDCKKGQLRNHEMTLTRKDGGTRTISWDFLNHFDENGNLVEIIGFGHDITERKKQETELQSLRHYLSNIIDSMPSTLIGVDIDGRVTQWNKTAERATGIDADAARGKFIHDVFPRMKLEMAKITESIRNRKTIQERKRYHLPDNRISYEDVTIYPLISNGLEGAVIRIDDVTNKVRMDEIMVQNEKMLSVGGLAAGMAHEINNPLAGIMQTADVMDKRLRDIKMPANRRVAGEIGIDLDDIKTYMEKRDILRMITTINESGRRVAEIVENMLSFARKSDTHTSLHDPVELMEKILQLASTDYDLKRQYDFKTIKIQREYEDNLPMVACEGAKIQQVLLNILRNGAQAMQEIKAENNGKVPKFILRLSREKETNMLRMEIEDNGPGMDESTLKRVFEPFFTTKPVGVGTGLGLSVSYFIITENHGGELSVESSPGSGAKFIIRLPLKGKKA